MEGTTVNNAPVTGTNADPVVQTVVNNPVSEPPTQPQAVNVDIQAIAQIAEQKAEQKMTAVFKDMLKQQGFDPEAINAVTAEWKSKQTTPEKELEAERQLRHETQTKLAQVEQELLALSKGVPIGSDNPETKAKADACITLARSYISDEVDFTTALEKAKQVMGFDTPAVTESNKQQTTATVMPQVVAPTQSGGTGVVDETMEKIMRNLK